jgi:DNA-binding transcriptional LysR family regulator
MRIDLFSLQLVASAIEHESIAKAAKLQNITASAASKRIAQIEYALGVPLLHRHKKGVKPTSAGLVMVRHATVLLKRLHRLEAELSEFSRGERGHVRICANTSAIVQHLSPQVVRFLALHPQLQVELIESSSHEVLRAVESGDADFGIFNGRVAPPANVNTLPFRISPLVIATPKGHALSGVHAIRFSEILNYAMIALSRDTTVNATLERAASHLERSLNIRIRVRSLDAARRMVHDGLGIAVLPEGFVRPYLNHLDICLIRLEEEWAYQELKIALRSWEELSLPVRLFLEHLTETGDDVST